MTPLGQYLTQSAARRRECDLCGNDGELRVYPMHGWTADDLLCAECFKGRDPENSFTDFTKVQDAAQ